MHTRRKLKKPQKKNILYKQTISKYFIYSSSFCNPLCLGKTHIKNVFFLVVGPLRVKRGVTPPPRPPSKKPLFFYKWRKFTMKLCNKNVIL